MSRILHDAFEAGGVTHEATGVATAVVTTTGAGTKFLLGNANVSAVVTTTGAGQVTRNANASVTAAVTVTGTGQAVRNATGTATVAITTVATGNEVFSGAGTAAVVVLATGNARVPLPSGRGSPDVVTSQPSSSAAGIVMRVVGTVTTKEDTATVAQTSVAASASSVTLLAANTDRQKYTIYNDSSNKLYVHEAATAATLTNQINVVESQTIFKPKSVYTGEVRGIWDVASGAARVAEYS